MGKDKIKIEIYESDPFTGCCGSGKVSNVSAESMRSMLTERNTTVAKLRKEFGDRIEIMREIINARTDIDTCPGYFKRILLEKGFESLPFTFIDGMLVSFCKFLSYEELHALVEKEVIG